MYTTDATITDIIVNETKIWLQLNCNEKYFPLHYEFDVRMMNDLSKILFLIKVTKAGNIEGLRGKNVRVIDTEKIQDSLIAIGSNYKNRFIDLYGSEYPISEKRIYRRYLKKEAKYNKK